MVPPKLKVGIGGWVILLGFQDLYTMNGKSSAGRRIGASRIEGGVDFTINSILSPIDPSNY
jgi:hypothetical protein